MKLMRFSLDLVQRCFNLKNKSYGNPNKNKPQLQHHILKLLVATSDWFIKLVAKSQVPFNNIDSNIKLVYQSQMRIKIKFISDQLVEKKTK